MCSRKVRRSSGSSRTICSPPASSACRGLVRVENGLPVLEDGRVVEAANVIWCTGFEPDFSWIEVPVFGEDGEPVHHRGEAHESGLYFLGLDFLFAFTSENVGGVGSDAAHVAKRIASAR